MYRYRQPFLIRWRKSPHKRGDVPRAIYLFLGRYEISPQAWGCTVVARQGITRIVNLPTSVGMYRVPSRYLRTKSKSPHKRGDVPLANRGLLTILQISPQAWGCTVLSRIANVFCDNLPTSVGMYRVNFRLKVRHIQSPHKRGDVPHYDVLKSLTKLISPQAWGCTEIM